MSHRILPPSPTFLAALPQSADDRYFFVGMGVSGYRVFEQADPVPNISNQADQLSFALDKNHSLFVEVADATGSHVVRSTDGTIVAEDAESPVISEDGNQLGFIRESKGRGSLWTTSLYPAQPHSPSLVLGNDYNVLDASFLRTGEFLLLAKRDGVARLYTVSPGSVPVPLFSSESDIASFSISPDQRSLVFTELIHNRWQLAVLTLSSGRVKVLTSTDCNAYTPSWSSPSSVIYATDCGRGLGLTALASIPVPPSE
jgi:Tol biopolymer transport system component